MASGTMHPKAYATSKVTGTYKTAAWATGTNTAVWTAPETGLYIVWMSFALSDDTATETDRNAYRQFQMNGTAGKLLSGLMYYDTSSSITMPFRKRVVCQPILVTQQGQTIYPYIHTNVANTVYNIEIIGVKIA